MKHTFGEYAAFTTKNSIRFQKHNKLIAEKSVPPEVVSFLRKKLDRPVDGLPKQEPLEELRPAVGAEIGTTPDNTPLNNTVLDTAKYLDDNDFIEAHVPPSPEEMKQAFATGAPVEQPDEMTDFVESVSIHTADLEDIANALYERFGIYTVYLKRPPVSDEVDPLTGEIFTKYHLGVAYQASIRARNSGTLTADPERHRQAMDAGREASQNRRDHYEKPATTMGEAQKANSFAYRTSVRGGSGYGKQPEKIISHVERDGVMRTERVESPSGTRTILPDGRDGMDEPIAEPQLRRQIIRPDWNN